MKNQVTAKDAKNKIRQMYVDLKKSLLKKEFGSYKILAELRELEKTFSEAGIKINAPRTLYKVLTKREKEKLYKDCWINGVETDKHSNEPYHINVFLAPLSYTPSFKAVGYVFCELADFWTKENLFLFYKNESVCSKYIPIAKDIVEDFLDEETYSVSWNERKVDHKKALELISQSKQVYLYNWNFRLRDFDIGDQTRE